MSRPLIVQSDFTMLLDVHDEDAERARAAIIPFSELIKSPEHLHTYKLSSLSLWNATSSGLTPDQILHTLKVFSKFEIPEVVCYFVEEMTKRFGSITLTPFDDKYYRLTVANKMIAAIILGSKELNEIVRGTDNELEFLVPILLRGEIKLKLIDMGYPVEDKVPLAKGKPLDIRLRSTTLSGKPFSAREYQEKAVFSFFGNDAPGSGYGTIVLPCGSGKTIVGLLAMAHRKMNTLILAPNISSVHQWINEIKDKTNLTDEDIGEYSGEKKEIRNITVCTYQVLTYRPEKDGEFTHFGLFKENDWGLIIYDEVHMLPAPVFKLTSEIQAVSRLGLTATLIREDGRENEVFSLVGPKRYDTPWSELEKQGFIATAICHEVRVNLPAELEIDYALAKNREKFKIASENPLKLKVVRRLLKEHEGDHIIIIGQYIDQLKALQKEFKFPLITGSTANGKRDKLYNDFRAGKEKVLIVSKVANFAIDLPDASVAIQVSGTFGSRQEEAQRLGRILRPKEKESHFYSIITRYSVEEEFAQNRQKFLSEQGYAYIAENAEED